MEHFKAVQTWRRCLAAQPKTHTARSGKDSIPVLPAIPKWPTNQQRKDKRHQTRQTRQTSAGTHENNHSYQWHGILEPSSFHCQMTLRTQGSFLHLLWSLSPLPSFALSHRSIASPKDIGPLLAKRSAVSSKARSHFTPSTCPRWTKAEAWALNETKIKRGIL